MDEQTKQQLTLIEAKITNYFEPRRKAGLLEESHLESWFYELRNQLFVPVKGRSSEIISLQNPNPEDNLRDEIEEELNDLKSAEKLEKRAVDSWLERFQQRLFAQFGFDSDETEIGEFIG